MTEALTGLNATTIALSTIAAIFLAIGCVGYSDNRETVQKVPWIYTKGSGEEGYFGLHKAYFTVDGEAVNVINYAQDCPESFCDKCHHDGQSAVGLLVTSLVFVALTILFSSIALDIPHVGFQLANIISGVLSVVTSVVAIGLFMNSCFGALDDATDTELKWGTGSILTTLGMLIMFIVTVLQIAATAVAGSGLPQEVPTTTSASALPVPAHVHRQHHHQYQYQPQQKAVATVQATTSSGPLNPLV